jgi:hypothetical protein
MDVTRHLARDVHTLGSIGPRSPRAEARAERQARAARYVSDRFGELGYVPAIDRFHFARRGARQREVDVLVAEHPGDSAAHRTLVVGAHYDPHVRAPGANDDATGIAVLLALAARLRGRSLARSVRLVAFPREEHASPGSLSGPFSGLEETGSRAYARRCRERGDCIDGMLAIEDVGHLGDSGLLDFFALVSNYRSRRLASRLHDALGPHPRVQARRLLLPAFLPLAKSSDHWSFWEEGWPAVMLTDGAQLRYRNHRSSEERRAVDFERLAAVARAVCDAVIRLAAEPR